MSQISASQHDAHGGSHAKDHAGHGAHGSHHADPLSYDNIHAPKGWGRTFFAVMLLAGVACTLATVAFPFVTQAVEPLTPKDLKKQALAAWLVGAMVSLGMVLGPMGLVLIFHLVKAGWSVTLRRQLENAASLWVWPALAVAPAIVFSSVLYKWTDPALMQSDALLQHKAPWLSLPFFIGRVVLYFFCWGVLSTLLVRLSRKQDITGDKWITNKLGFHSAWGILLFALTTAFAGVDLVKTLDFHWFSTMWGVYFFAGNMIAGLSLLILVLTALRKSGRLQGVVTEEHFHDLGKMLLGFTVFWAYISFSQYFLYWYANIPEETAFFMLRKNNGWQFLYYALIFGHFCIPFIILLFRGVKRSMTALSVLAGLLLLMHTVDIFWYVRPVVFMQVVVGQGENVPGITGFAWVDLTGVLGPICISLALLAWKIGQGPLIPLRDPRLPEALHHKNYV
jgi:hypothetical protein